MRTRSGPQYALLCAVAGAGALGVLAITRWGIGTSPDSAQYIRAARLAGDEVAGVASSHFPPLYSSILAVSRLVGADPMIGARWLNAMVLALNTCLVGMIARRATRTSSALWVVAGVLAATAMPMLSVHAVALSEPVFLVVTLLSIYLLGDYLERGQWRVLASAAIMMGLACLARYAGVAGVVAGVVSIAVWSNKSVTARARDALLFLVVSTGPVAVWIAANVMSGGSATGRVLSLHPIGSSHVWQGIYTVSSWMFLPSGLPDFVRILVALGLVLGLALILVRATMSVGTSRTVDILALYAASYASFLAVSISLFDANTPLDGRILLPVFVVGIILGVWIVDALWSAKARHPASAYGGVALLTALVFGHATQGIQAVGEGYDRGWGFASVRWQRSATLATARALPQDVVMYSNAPELVYLHTGRVAQVLPKKAFLMTQTSNREYSLELEDVAAVLSRTCGVVVYVSGLQQQWLPTRGELRTKLSLGVWRQYGDGAILRPRECLE